MKVMVNKDSLIVGCFPLRKICMIEVIIEDDNEIYEGYIPYYMSSGTNVNKVKGKWYPILGVFYKGETVRNCISYFIKLACGEKYETIEEGWLMKSPFFVNFDGYIKDENKVPNGFGNHKFTNKLEMISDIISELHSENRYTKDNELQFDINKRFNNQDDIDYLVQYMIVGQLI